MLVTREPGGSPGAEEIRGLLLGGGSERWDVETEALLMLAARRDHLRRTVWPALAEGRHVICDRFADSTLAYQGYGRGMALEDLRAIQRIVAGDVAPDLTLILDLPVEIGLARAAARGDRTRFEAMDLAFHERLRAGFRRIADAEPQRCVVIDASCSVDIVQAALRAVIAERLGLRIG